MLLSIDLKDAKKLSQGSVQLRLDWGKKEWTVGGDQLAWKRVGFTNRGRFEVPSPGIIWVWDQPAGQPKANTMIVWDAPGGPAADVGTYGEGRLYAPKDPKMKDGLFDWVVDAKSGTVAAAAPTATAATQAKIRDDVIKLIGKEFLPRGQLKEPPNCLESKARTKTAGGATGCGGFPGWVITKLIAQGYKFAPDAVKVTWEETVVVDGVKTKKTKSDTVRVTSPTTAWENLAKGIEKRRIGEGKATAGSLFVEYKPTEARRPKPGDIYLLKQENGWFRHVGVIIDASKADWITADGGQGAGFAVGYRSRPLNPATGLISGEDAKKAYVKAWVDLEALVEA
jgi:hypothetical protein